MIQFYLAGPYTGPDQAAIWRNVVTACRVAAEIALHRGWWPIVPHTSGIHSDTGLRDEAWAQAMKKCIHTVVQLRPHIDKLVLMPGWETSEGARIEARRARDLEIDVWTMEQALDPQVLDFEVDPEEVAP
jgi:hypothetical protein